MSNRPSETSLDQLIDNLRYRPNAVIAAQMREAAKALKELQAVAVAAQALVRTAFNDGMGSDTECVNECALTVLETALAEAGYDMTEQELEEAL